MRSCFSRIAMLFCALLVCRVAFGADAENKPEPLADKVAKAHANASVLIDVGGYGVRNSTGLVYLPDEKSFLVIGGSLGKGGPYSEVTLNPATSHWENRFPVGKENVWGDVTGPSKAPPRAYGGPGFEVTEGVLRPHLDFGYNHSMEIWGNAAYDAARGKVVVPFHRLMQTYEYDPKARTWQLLTDDPPFTFWDDIVFGAMCYDPVNKEVLAGQGRWVLRGGKWEPLQLGSALINGLRGKSEELGVKTHTLAGACRARFYITESDAMAKAKLDESAAALVREIRAFSEQLGSSSAQASAYEKQQLEWALADLKTAEQALDSNGNSIQAKVTPEAIAAIDGAVDALDYVAEDLAVFPPKRAYFRPAVDEKRGKIVVFGGHRLDRVVADTWVYDCQSRTWEQRRPKLSPPPRYGHGFVWLAKSGKMLLVDGAGRAEYWIYDLDANTWSLLDTGGEVRESLTSGASTWGWQPETSAATPDDLVITLANRQESKIPRFSTWASRIDVSAIDAAGTQKLGVPFRKVDFVDGPTFDPHWYEKNAGDVAATAAAQQEWIDKLPANTWVARDRKAQRNNPNENRAWGTTILDPEHDQMLQWGGGHVAYVGNSVLHYSIRSDQFFIGHRPEQGLMYAAGQGGMKMAMSYRKRAFVTGHSYHSYGYDPLTGLLIVCGQTVEENTCKTSMYLGYNPATTEWLPTPILTPFPAHYGMDRLCSTPNGMVVWPRAGGLWRLDAASLKWVAMPLTGAPLTGIGHEAHGLVYDSKRDRLLMFSHASKGEVTAYDVKTGVATLLGPAGKGTTKEFACRESVYLPEWDAVLILAPLAEPDGTLRWPLYDCQKNAWFTVLIGGPSPSGKTYSCSHGLMYDAKRKLIWTSDHVPNISALRLDLKTADLKPLQ